jgi:mannose-6-phosphate isomerase-like protein (cupin superfamily)
MKNSVSDCKLLELPKIESRLGNLTSIQNSIEVPFDIERIFYLYDIPGGKDRGAHAHIECHQFLIAGSGSFTVLVDDGKSKKKIILNSPNIGLYIPPGIWASETNFSSGSVCLVLTSDKYDEKDYIRDYNDYLKFIK